RSRTRCGRTCADRPAPSRPRPTHHLEETDPVPTITTPLPPLKEIRDLLSGLVGRGCTAERAGGVLTPETAGVVAATYVSGRAQVEAVVAVDLALGAALGAAIGLMPPGLAHDAAKDGELSDVLLENLVEVLNVLASLF